MIVRKEIQIKIIKPKVEKDLHRWIATRSERLRTKEEIILKINAQHEGTQKLWEQMSIKYLITNRLLQVDIGS